MAPVLLKEFVLPIDHDAFIQCFWSQSTFYEKFLLEKLKDIDVTVQDWIASNSNNSNIQTISSQERNVRSFHPSKISFPGLPSHAESLKSQVLEVRDSRNFEEPRVIINEVNSFVGIPYADYFQVITEWRVHNKKSVNNSNNSNNNNNNNNSCTIRIYLEVKFMKSTWLQGTIESNTKAELVEVFELWLEAANLYIRQVWESIQQQAQLANNNNPVSTSATTTTNNNINNTVVVSSTTVIATHKLQIEVPKDNNNQHDIENDIDNNDDDDAETNNTNNPSTYASDEELLFYDCADDDLLPGQNGHSTPGGSNRRRSSYSSTYRSTTGSAANITLLSTTRSLQNLEADEYHDHDRKLASHSNSSIDSYYSNDSHHRGHTNNGLHSQKKSSSNGQQETARDIAISIVESIFVLAEFSFWQVYQFYAYDLKDLFNVEPQRVVSRVINSFLPGWHGPVLARPDIYGPLLAVFTLPQVLLLCMETTKHGCNATSQLGNAVVVCLLTWLGLSLIYRLLALLIAPNMTITRCLSVIGYSFFAWNLALLCTLPLEQFSKHHHHHYHYTTEHAASIASNGTDHSTDAGVDASASPSSSSNSFLFQLPVLLPLVLFGVPSSVAQGYIFWEFAPHSTMTLQPSILPASMQQFATQNSRCIQRMLWIFPKVLAFIIVAGTHYQLLWYLARVFLPGRRQLCRLSALIQPSQYADILTQKELRIFALKLISGRLDED